MRSAYTILLLVASSTASASAQGTEEGRFVTGPSGFPVDARLIGSFLVDSANIHVHIDTARFWISKPSEVGRWIGGIAVAVAKNRSGSWTFDDRSKYLLVNQQLSLGDTLVRQGLDLSIPRAHVNALAGHWLVFSIALGSLEGRADLPPLTFVFVHTSHDLFAVSVVRRARRESHQEDPDVPLRLRGCSDLPPTNPTLGSGVVRLTFIVDTLGRVEPESIKSSKDSNPALVDAASLHVRTCRFSPSRIDHRLVRVETVMPIRF